MFLGIDNTADTIDAFAYDSAGAIWNGAAYVAVPADSADPTAYRIAATRKLNGLYGTLPAGADRWELRVRGSTFDGSAVVWEGPEAVDTTDIADAVRDVSNASPASGSLGEKVNAAAASSITITPFMATATNPRHTTKDIAAIFAGSTPTDFWVIKDAAGSPVDLSAKTVRLVGVTADEGDDAASPFDDTFTAAWQYQTGGNGITVGGTGHNTVTVQYDAAKTATAGDYRYWLVNVTDKTVLATGKFPIKPAPTGLFT